MQKVNFAVTGPSRSNMAAAIATRQHAWGAYELGHADAFNSISAEKFLAVNSKGDVVARAGYAGHDSLVVNDATVRHEDFLTIQSRLVEIRRRSLNGIADLEGAGLVFDEDITKQLVGFENYLEFEAAKREMNPNTTDNNDSVFGEDFVPCPIMHSSFEVVWRQQGFDYKRSVGLRESARKVLESAEDLLFNGDSTIAVKYSGTSFPIYGYTTHPNRGTDTISDWTNPANAGTIINELIEQCGLTWSTQGGVMNGRLMVYVANDIWNNLQNDYNQDYPSAPILERMKNIAQVMDVKPAEELADGNVVLVEMEPRTIELARESDLVAIPHTKVRPFQSQAFTTYMAAVPLIKVDGLGKTGIRHLSP